MPPYIGPVINTENVDDPALKASMKFVNHPSTKTIKDRFPNNGFYFNKVTKSNIWKKIIHLNSAKTPQDSDIPTKLMKQNVDIVIHVLCLLSIIVWKMPSSHQF